MPSFTEPREPLGAPWHARLPAEFRKQQLKEIAGSENRSLRPLPGARPAERAAIGRGKNLPADRFRRDDHPEGGTHGDEKGEQRDDPRARTREPAGQLQGGAEARQAGRQDVARRAGRDHDPPSPQAGRRRAQSAIEAADPRSVPRGVRRGPRRPREDRGLRRREPARDPRDEPGATLGEAGRHGGRHAGRVRRALQGVPVDSQQALVPRPNRRDQRPKGSAADHRGRVRARQPAAGAAPLSLRERQWRPPPGR